MSSTQDRLPVQIETTPDLRFEDRFRQAMAFVKGAITILGGLAEANPDDLDGLAFADALVQRMRRELGVLDDDIQKLIWRAMGDEREAIVDGIGLLKKDFGGQNTAWQHDVIWARIRRELVRSYTDANGEMDESANTVVDQTIALVRAVIGQGSYKKSGLKEIGFAADEVSKTSWGKRRIAVIGVGK